MEVVIDQRVRILHVLKKKEHMLVGHPQAMCCFWPRHAK